MAGSLNFLFGPLTSILCDRFGCRRVAFVGAVLSVTGLFLTSLVTRLHYMYLTYGLLWGIGSSFSFVPSIVMLGEYFDKRLALANGLGTSGSGVGSLVASPAINYLLRVVGWSNSLRILSGAAVFLVVACFLYKPYKTVMRQRDRNVTKQCSQLCDVSIWKNRAYVAWVLTVALFQFGYPVPFVHLVSLRCGFVAECPEGCLVSSLPPYRLTIKHRAPCLLSVISTYLEFVTLRWYEKGCWMRRLLLHSNSLDSKLYSTVKLLKTDRGKDVFMIFSSRVDGGNECFRVL